MTVAEKAAARREKNRLRSERWRRARGVKRRAEEKKHTSGFDNATYSM
jgi:hypothetical protein